MCLPEFPDLVNGTRELGVALNFTLFLIPYL